MADASSVLQTWLDKLKSSDPALREDAIKALELIGDTGALPVLADVFATDPDPALRALAQWAGKSIYYGAVRQGVAVAGSSEEEQRQAAEILARAEARKLQSRRGS